MPWYLPRIVDTQSINLWSCMIKVKELLQSFTRTVLQKAWLIYPSCLLECWQTILVYLFVFAIFSLHLKFTTKLLSFMCWNIKANFEDILLKPAYIAIDVVSCPHRTNVITMYSCLRPIILKFKLRMKNIFVLGIGLWTFFCSLQVLYVDIEYMYYDIWE